MGVEGRLEVSAVEGLERLLAQGGAEDLAGREEALEVQAVARRPRLGAGVEGSQDGVVGALSAEDQPVELELGLLGCRPEVDSALEGVEVQLAQLGQLLFVGAKLAQRLLGVGRRWVRPAVGAAVGAVVLGEGSGGEGGQERAAAEGGAVVESSHETAFRLGECSPVVSQVSLANMNALGAPG